MATNLTVNRRRRGMSMDALARRFESWDPDRVLGVGLWLALAAAVANVATQVIDFQFYDLRIAVLDSDTHASLFGVLSLLAQAAVAAAVVGRGVSSARRGSWLVLAGLLVALLIVRASLPEDPAALAPPLAVVFVMLWLLTADDCARAPAVIRVALFLLAFSFLVHVVGLKIVDALGYGYNTWPYEIKAMLKHSAELSGWMLVVTGLIAGSRFVGDARSTTDGSSLLAARRLAGTLRSPQTRRS